MFNAAFPVWVSRFAPAGADFIHQMRRPERQPDATPARASLRPHRGGLRPVLGVSSRKNFESASGSYPFWLIRSHRLKWFSRKLERKRP